MSVHKMIVALTVVGALQSSFGLAAETPASEAVDSIEVTEKRADLPLGTLAPDVPLAGTVISRDVIENLLPVNYLTGLLQGRVPGVSLIRNLRIPDGGNNYTDVEIDGMRQMQTGNFNFLDLYSDIGAVDHIDILRGPGTVQNMSYAIGGTINVHTFEPPQKMERFVWNQMGTVGLDEGGGRIGDTFSGNGDGYIIDFNARHNDGARSHSTEDKYSGSSKLVLKPDEDSTLKFRFEFLHDQMKQPGNLTLNQVLANWLQNQPNTYSNVVALNLSPQITYQRTVGDYGEVFAGWAFHQTDQTTFGQSLTNGSTAGADQVIDNVQGDNSFKVWYRHEIDSLKSSLYAGFNGDVIDQKTHTYSNAGKAQVYYVRGALSSQSASTEVDTSPYVRLEVEPLPRLRVSVGVRQDLVAYDYSSLSSTSALTGTAFYRNLTKKADLSYQLAKDTFFWSNVAEGWLPPTNTTQLLGSGGKPCALVGGVHSNSCTYVAPNLSLVPQESVTYEVGIRGALPVSEVIKYDIGVYQTNLSNYVVSVACASTETCANKYDGGVTATFKGLEGGVTWDAADWLSFTSTTTLTHNVYERYVSTSFASGVTTTTNYSKKSYKGSPDSHTNLVASIHPMPEWLVELEYDHISQYYTDSANTNIYQRPDLVNIRTNYAFENGIKLWLNLTNITNAHYGALVNYTAASGSTPGYQYYQMSNPGLPLTAVAGVSVKF